MNTPLVSVTVLTYNSSKTVIETLDSIFTQTYPRIELLISDDCSQDNSVELCKNWLKSHNHRFERSLLLESSTNQGISKNGNKVKAAAQGEWIKGIAADDRLLPNCISDFMDYISYHPEAKIIFSKVVGFGDEEAARKWPFKDVSTIFSKLTQEEIRIALCISNFLPAPSCIINTQTFKELGGYNEDIPLQEDWTFWMKATNSGIKLHFMNKETVEYRFSTASLSQSNLSEKYLDSNRKAQEKGKYYLNRTFGANLCFYTINKCKNGGIIWRFIHLINLLNPFYHKYIKSQKIISQLSKK